MAQIKIYGLKTHLSDQQTAISTAIHAAVMTALDYPAEKKFQRFISLDNSEFIYPDDRSDKYTIIEISMFEGRSTEAKKNLIRAIYSNMTAQTDISPQDIEITLFETPRENWGIRGLPGDELTLNYTVDV